MGTRPPIPHNIPPETLCNLHGQYSRFVSNNRTLVGRIIAHPKFITGTPRPILADALMVSPWHGAAARGPIAFIDPKTHHIHTAVLENGKLTDEKQVFHVKELPSMTKPYPQLRAKYGVVDDPSIRDLY